MESSIKKLAVASITFESNDPDVLVKGSISIGQLTYPTDFIISHTQLNVLINQLNKQNEHLKFEQLVKTEKMYNDETIYTACLDDSISNQVNMNNLFVNNPVVEIRA